MVGDLMLFQRVISALVGIPLILAAVWYGGGLLAILLALLILLAQFELNRILSRMEIKVTVLLNALCSLAFLGMAFWGINNLSLVFGAVTFIYLGSLVFKFPTYTFADVATNLLGVFYTGWFLSLLYQIRGLPEGIYYLSLLFFCNWASDTFAYFVGMNVGKTRLAPEVSPKKSVEGSIGGMIGAILVAMAFKKLLPQADLWMLAFLGLFISLFGQLGDLVESALKRQAGIKDSGNLIPGHGGVLDRFDSVLLSAPLVYHYVTLLIL